MAQLKHIFRGESLTILLTFPEAYDMVRIEKHEIYIGTKAFTGVVSGQSIELKLTSEQTDAMYGKQPISLWLDDSVLGVRKPYVGDIIVSNSNATPDNDSTSSITDIIIPIAISETAITVRDVLYNYIKGDPFEYSDFTPEQLEALKVKGDPFEFSDFTPEQIALLQQPASDAAGSVALLEGEIEGEEALRIAAETTRVQNEQSRVTAEGIRQSNEIARENSEDDREDAEEIRLSAEITRGQNETARISAETNRVNNEAVRQNKEAERQQAETIRSNNETARISAETTRGQNETTRQTKETERQNAETARQLAGYITSPSAMQIVQLTQAQYDALPVKVATTIYLIIQA